MRHQHAEQDVRTVRGGDHDRVLDQPIQHVRQGHPGDDEPTDLTTETVGLAPVQLTADVEKVGHGRRRQERLLRQRVRRRQGLQGMAHIGESLRLDPVHHGAKQLAGVGRQLGDCGVGNRPDVLRRALSPVEHEEDRRTEIGGDPGVEGELGGVVDVGVVAADDDDRIALPCHLVVSVDDGPKRGVAVGMHVVVCHAGAHVVPQVGAVVLQQQFEHVVGPSF